MKLTKRFMATILCVMLVMSSIVSVPAFAEFNDLPKEHNAYEAVDVLSKLGVINGYEENGSFNFKPENNVTRAEFTAMLLRTRGMGSIGSMSLENPPFPDVVTPDVSWAIGNIRTARELGIINGYDDGTFLPNNNVLYEEAVKMIVCALGYGEMGAEGAHWYSKYLMTATSLKFTEGAGGAIGVPATRATIANMLYNCLEIKLAENNEVTDKTILENDLGLIKNVGYIDANPEISLSKPDSNLRDNELQIAVPNASGIPEVSTYKVENIDEYKDMLGAQITFYYTIDRNSGLRNLLMAQVKESETIEIDAASIIGASSSAIEYVKSDNSGRELSAGIAPNSIVVYNGKLYGTGTLDSTFSAYRAAKGAAALPTIGKIKLLDRDGDNSYDVLFIDSYDAYVVSSKTTSNYTVIDNVLRKGLVDPNNKVVLNPKDTTFYDASGNKSSFSSINTGGVICVKTSNAGNGGSVLNSVIICNNSVSGKVTATNSKGEITIAGKTYKSSAQAPWKNVISGANPDTTAPTTGDSGKFYFDCDGNVLIFDKTETVSNQQYGYLINAVYSNDDFEEKVNVTIITKANPSGKTYSVTDKSKLNGSPVTLSTFQSDIDLANDGADRESGYPSSSADDYAQLVKFTTGKNDQIDEIVTATVSSQTPEKPAEDILNLYDAMLVTKPASYSNSKFSATGAQNIYIKNALILKIPSNKNDSSKYRVMSASELETSTSGTYRVELYDVNATYSAKVALVYQGAAAAGTVKAGSPVVVIKDIIRSDRYELIGYNGTTYQLSTDDVKTTNVAPTLMIGDVVRLGKDDAGYYTVRNDATDQHIIFRAQGAYRDTLNNPNKIESGPNGTNEYEVVWGSAYRRSDEGLMISYDVLAGTEAEDTITHRDILPMNNFNNAKIYTFEIKNDTNLNIIEHEQAENIDIVNALQIYDSVNTPKPDEIFVHASVNKVKTMIIVKRISE